jgi:hypothetical protein
MHGAAISVSQQSRKGKASSGTDRDATEEVHEIAGERVLRVVEPVLHHIFAQHSRRAQKRTQQPIIHHTSHQHNKPQTVSTQVKAEPVGAGTYDGGVELLIAELTT